jgi:hypothetical protein
MHATGKVRLHVTGKPATINGSDFFSLEHATRLEGKASAEAAFSSPRRLCEMGSGNAMRAVSSTIGGVNT